MKTSLKVKLLQRIGGCLSLIGMGLALALPFSSAYASQDPSFGICSFIASPITIDMGTMDVPTDSPGATFVTKSGIPINTTCSYDTTDPKKQPDHRYWYRAVNGLDSRFSNTWTTGISGVDVRVERTSAPAAFISTVEPSAIDTQTSPTSPIFNLPNSSENLPKDGVFTFSLIRTGDPIKAGAYSQTIFLLQDRNIIGEWSPVTNVVLQVNFNTPTCKVSPGSDTAKPIQLPTVSAGTINENTPVGNTAFSIRLICDPTITDAVYITLTDATDPANRSNNLTAQGPSNVALRLSRDDGTPIEFGADSSDRGNLNQWNAGTPVGGLLSIPLHVGYIAKSRPIGTGALTASATFTLSYP